MMIITTVSEKISGTEARVFWRVGTKKKGILDVTLEFAHEESALLGELVAIQYLLFTKKVFDREPGSGQGYKLVVSKGAIRKLALGKSSKKFAGKFARFLTNRMKGATIDVSQSYEFMPSIDECNPKSISGECHSYAKVFDEIETPAMGRVKVTKHAVEQYEARITSGLPKKPWASLVNRLQHPELRIHALDAKVLAHKARKYGRSDNIEAWGHPASSFIYLVIRDDKGKRALVTVFGRNDMSP